MNSKVIPFLLGFVFAWKGTKILTHAIYWAAIVGAFFLGRIH